MKLILPLLLAIVLLAPTACVTMEDCCECLSQAGALECHTPQEECVAACFELCEPTRACYCSDAREVGCEAECGCDR